MSIVLSVISSGNNTDGEMLEHTFSESGGTIGRRMSNAWILPDENRHLSGSHASISYEHGSYYITDTSTNGVFLDGNSEAIGRGERQKLEEGSQLLMGTFKISVSIKTQEDLDAPVGIPLGEPLDKSTKQSCKVDSDDLFADLDDDSIGDLEPLPVKEAISIEEKTSIPADAGSDDPFFEFGDFTSSDDDLVSAEHVEGKDVEDNIPELDSFFKPADIRAKDESVDHAKIPEVKENVAKPPPSPSQVKAVMEKPSTSSSVIPDDWTMGSSGGDAFDDLFAGMDDPFAGDDDPFAFTNTDNKQSSKAVEPVFEEEKEPLDDDFFSDGFVEDAKKEPRVEQKKEVETKPAFVAPPADIPPLSSGVASGAASAFMKGLGVDEKVFGSSFSEKDLYLAGKLFRTALQGTMEVLQSRAEIKNEMRMDMTTIRPIQNNPIKFAVNADEALKKMFLQKNSSYMDPQQAMDEAFDDIKSHQIAVISGIQASLVSVLRRFEPENLVKRLEKESPISASIPIHRKAKLWDKFEALYDTIESEAEDDFNRLFGQEFAKAYDEQVSQLEKQRTMMSSKEDDK